MNFLDYRPMILSKVMRRIFIFHFSLLLFLELEPENLSSARSKTRYTNQMTGMCHVVPELSLVIAKFQNGGCFTDRVEE